jgi:histidine triad (HIT) family protein
MTDCPFCAIVRGDAPAWVVHETDSAIAFFATGPAAPYHTLVVPKRHAADLFEISPEDWAGVTSAVKDVADLYRQRLGVEAIELTQHSGAAAQQGVSHLHVHVLPRHEGDGQDTHWTEHPEIEDRFDALLARLTG